MKFFVSAMEEDGNGILAREIEAEDFDGALATVLGLGAEQFAGHAWRVTSVTEVPEINFRFPMAVMATGVVHGLHLKGRNAA